MSEKTVLGLLAVVSYGLAIYLFRDITWQESGGVFCLVLGGWLAQSGNKL